MITLVYNNLGEIELQKNNIERAKNYFYKTLEFPTGYISWITRRINTYTQLSKIYQMENNIPKALNYADSAKMLLPAKNYFQLKIKFIPNLRKFIKTIQKRLYIYSLLTMSSIALIFHFQKLQMRFMKRKPNKQKLKCNCDL